MKKYFLLFVLSFSIFIVHTIYTKHAIYGDGNGYYVYTQSLYFDHTLNSDAIYKHLENFEGRNYTFSRVFWNPKANPYLIGTGIIWLPSMAFMSLFSMDRFDVIYELGPGITGIILMLSGFYFLEKHLITLFNKGVVFWAILTIFFGSNVFYYTAFEPALSHQPAFFIISYLLYQTTKKSRNIFLVGLLSGLLAIVRIADIIALLTILYMMKIKIKEIYKLLFGFIIAISPQIYTQYYFYHNILTNPYLTGASGTWRVSINHLLEYLFSIKRGLFIWTPVFVMGIVGLVKSKKTVIIVSILLAWFIHSSWSAYLSAGFGQRFSFSLIPFITIGLAYLYEKFESKKIYMLFSLFTIWNFLLLLGFYLLKWKNAA